MIRLGRIAPLVGAGVVAIACMAFVNSSSAEAGCGPVCCTSHCHYHHHGCGHYRCYTPCCSVYPNCAVTCNNGTCAAVAPQPTANVFVYDLYYTDAQGQSQNGGRFFVTVSSVSTNWGGFDTAQSALAKAGLKTTYAAQFWKTTVI